MTVLDREIALLNAAIYAPDNTVDWDTLDTGAADDGVYWGLVHMDDLLIVVFRGSVTMGDFERDAETMYWNDRELGSVHMGFLQGIKDVWSELNARLRPGKWMVCGHSLGAARALLFGALGCVRGSQPVGIVTFGSPRPGFTRLKSILAPVRIRSYRNRDDKGHDLITDVPAYLPPVFPYEHPRPLIDVSASPSDPTDDGPFRYHHIQLYVKALEGVTDGMSVG